jgi:2-deoxy-scyllo-inosamine dehydrogenase (SAM-dependent)
MADDEISTVTLETITACNRRCSYCPNSEFDRGLTRNAKRMDGKLFIKIIDELAEIDSLETFMPHFFGEPLLDNRMSSLISYVRKRIPKVDIHLYTNGDLLTVDKYKILTQAGVNKFVVSEHGPETRTRLLDIVNYRQRYGIDNVSIDVKIFWEGEELELMDRGGLIGSEKFSKIVACDAPSNTVIIDAQGNVVLCCNDYLGTAKFGNLENQKLMDIWNDGQYIKIRKELREGIFNLDMCKKCNVIWLSAPTQSA